MEIKKGIGKALQEFKSVIRLFKMPVKSKQLLHSLALKVTNHNKEIAAVVTDALLETGLYGIINIEESGGLYTSFCVAV